MNSLFLLTLALTLLVATEGAALACIGLCRIQQLDLRKSKVRWMACYTLIFLLGTAVAFEPLMHGTVPAWVRGIEIAVLGLLLWAVLRTRSRWKDSGKPAAPPESNRAPLGDK